MPWKALPGTTKRHVALAAADLTSLGKRTCFRRAPWLEILLRQALTISAIFEHPQNPRVRSRLTTRFWAELIRSKHMQEIRPTMLFSKRLQPLKLSSASNGVSFIERQSEDFNVLGWSLCVAPWRRTWGNKFMFTCNPYVWAWREQAALSSKQSWFWCEVSDVFLSQGFRVIEYADLDLEKELATLIGKEGRLHSLFFVCLISENWAWVHGSQVI